MRKLRVIIGCEESGVVRRAFRALGHDAWSCDLLPSEDNSRYHVQGDLMEFLSRRYSRWDLGIFHPPCTYILNSGCKHLYQGMKRWNSDGSENPRNEDRWAKMVAGAMFFKACLDADIPCIAVENPIMVGYAKEIIGWDQDQTIHPWQFGHMESKATCLWLKNLPPLRAADNVYDEMMKLPKNQREKVHYASPGPKRSQQRSRTYDGIGEAMAAQWGDWVSKL